MAFYDLPEVERKQLVQQIEHDLQNAVLSSRDPFLKYFSDEDTYIRKAAYLSVGKIYRSEKALRNPLLKMLDNLFTEENFKVRQTVINSAGEIAKTDFGIVTELFEKGLLDSHHSVRNAVIGSLKKSGEKNPVDILSFAKKHLHHTDVEVRRQVVHGIELRGRTHPQEVLPLLRELEFEKIARVRNMIVHVLGQIAYKKGCLETVVADLLQWENKKLVEKALEEIIDVHYRYADFSYRSAEEATKYIYNSKTFLESENPNATTSDCA